MGNSTIQTSTEPAGLTLSFCQRPGRVPGLFLHGVGGLFFLFTLVFGWIPFFVGLGIAGFGSALSWCWIPRVTLRVSRHAVEVHAFGELLPIRRRWRGLRRDPSVRIQRVGGMHDQPVYDVWIGLGDQCICLRNALIDVDDLERLRAALTEGLHPVGRETDIPEALNELVAS